MRFITSFIQAYMETIFSKELLDLLLKGGLNVIMLIVWIITLREHKKETSKIIAQHEKQYNDIIALQRETISVNNKQYAELVERNFKYIDQNLQYQMILTGLLSKIEVKLDNIERNQK